MAEDYPINVDDLNSVIDTLEEEAHSASPSEREMDRVSEELAGASTEAAALLREIESLQRRSNGIGRATTAMSSGLRVMNTATEHVRKVGKRRANEHKG